MRRLLPLEPPNYQMVELEKRHSSSGGVELHDMALQQTNTGDCREIFMSRRDLYGKARRVDYLKFIINCDKFAETLLPHASLSTWS